MGSKLFTPALLVLKYVYDFSLNPQSVVGVVDLGDLPEGFVVQSVSTQEVDTVTATTTIKTGPTADDDGFNVAADLSGVVRGEGALVYNSVDKRPLEYVVAASQKMLLTTAVAPAVAGKVAIFVQGYQAF